MTFKLPILYSIVVNNNVVVIIGLRIEAAGCALAALKVWGRFRKPKRSTNPQV